MNIDEMANQFTTMRELREYCNSQYSVIVALNRKINDLEEQNKSLLQIVEKASPLLAEQDGKLEVYKNLSDEMAICLMQIKILKDKSIDSELSFEDTKKLEIFTKVLTLLKAGNELPDGAAQHLSDTELTKLLEEQLSPVKG